MRAPWIKWDPKYEDRGSSRRQGRGHGKAEAEMGGHSPGPWELQTLHRVVPEGGCPANTWNLDLGLHTCESKYVAFVA